MNQHKQILLKAIISLLIGFGYSYGVDLQTDSHKTLVDQENNLMWQNNEESIAIKKDWMGAILYCDNLVLESYEDWRVPTIEELQTIYRSTILKQNVDDLTQNTRQIYYWSNSPIVSGITYAYRIHFYNGDLLWGIKENSYNVRCVRDLKRERRISL